MARKQKVFCQECGSLTDMPFSVDDRVYCEGCYRYFYRVCAHCDTVIPRERAYSRGEHYYCEDCYDLLFFICDSCSTVYDREESYESDDSIILCRYCFERYYEYCEQCNCIVHTDNVIRVDGYGYCESCAEDHIVIRPYGSTEARRFYGDDHAGRYYGIELEVECENNDREAIAKNLRERYGEDKFDLKNDGTLDNGFEIATQPCTIDYHKKKFDWKGILWYLLENNCKSHKTGTCGLHIHVSRDSLTQSQEDKMFLFIVTNKDKIKVLSRRAKFTYCQFNDEKTPCPKKIKEKIKNIKSVDRYSALHISGPTVELRIFRGTLRYQSFCAALEFYDAMIVFCAMHGTSLIASEKCWCVFKNFVKKRQYKYLYNYVIERGI